VSEQEMSIKLKQEEHISVYKDRLMIMKWKDKKDVCLISTTDDDKMVPLIIIPEWEVRTSVMLT
jgi:hypothetical protein